jgi:beta-glucanase (GH16 family)
MPTDISGNSPASPAGPTRSQAANALAIDGPRKRSRRRHWIEFAAVAVVLVIFTGGALASTLRADDTSRVDGAVAHAPRSSDSVTVGQQPAGSPASSTSASPSKNDVALAATKMPVGDLPGWRQTFTENFNGTQLSHKWNVYSGQPGGDPGGWWEQNHVTVGKGLLNINGSKESTPHGSLYVTGGISNSPSFSQTYGRFEVRFRMDAGYGVAYALILWPTSNVWPPEIDIAEDDGRLREYTTSTMHYGANDSKIHRTVNGNFTKWHTATVDWTPGHIVYYLDGHIWGTIDSSHVPNVPMHIALQAQAWYCSSNWAPCPNSTTPKNVNLQIDWVAAYKWMGH